MIYHKHILFFKKILNKISYIYICYYIYNIVILYIIYNIIYGINEIKFKWYIYIYIICNIYIYI